MKNPTIPQLLDKKTRSSYANARQTWSIQKSQIIFDMILPWFFIAFALMTFWVFNGNTVVSVCISILAPIYFSYWKQAFTVFLHEAAHYNLTKNKKLNDLISNLILTPFTGLWVKQYRDHHWEHHKSFGQNGDTETSYVLPLNVRGIIESLTGIYLVKTAMRYLNVASATNEKREVNLSSSLQFVAGLTIMLSAQLLIAVLLFFFINPYAGFVWMFSVFITDPLIAKIRQTLEHRNEHDKVSSSFLENNDLGVNQIFGNDFFSRYFGGAGFNRHLLHHLDPSVSYTRFDEFERFLQENGSYDYIERRRVSYLSKFLQIIDY